MFAGLVERVRPQMIQGRINRISLKGHWAETEDGRRFAYDALVSTMPLVKLVAIIEEQPEELLQELPCFLHNSLHLVSLVVDRPNITDMQRLYVADPGIPFHKLVFNSNSSPSMKNHPNGFPIQAEVIFSPNKNVPAIGLTERVIEGLHQVGILNKDDSVIESDLRTIRYAYPVLTKEVARSRQRVKDYLLNYDVYCGGRFGEWLYINSDTAVARGMELADVINGNLAHS
jgi:protoporphyrinogen oxidase